MSQIIAIIILISSLFLALRKTPQRATERINCHGR